MLINEVSKITGLTKKAIVYYTMQGLITPSILNNGYRYYSANDVELLKRIAVLRKLGVSMEEIRDILQDDTTSALQAASIQKELECQWQEIKNTLLEELSSGRSYGEIVDKLNALDNSKTITEKILEAFPGYYGRFICLHFARFLDEPAKTDDQQAALDTILSYLDNIPPFDLPKDLEEYLLGGTKHIGTSQIAEMIESTENSIENPDDFLTDSNDVLEQYLDYKLSDEYKDSFACKLLDFMKEFNSTSGYNDVFIPAMKRLSSSYSSYCLQLDAANEKLLAKYPQIRNLDEL